MGCGCNKKKSGSGYKAARSDRPRRSLRALVSPKQSKILKRPKRNNSVCPKCGSLLKKTIKRHDRKEIVLLQCVNNVCTYATKG